MNNMAEKYSCKIEALVTIDKRGQMVLPKDLRDKANIKAGDRLGVIYGEKNNKYCISLVKMDCLNNHGQK